MIKIENKCGTVYLTKINPHMGHLLQMCLWYDRIANQKFRELLPISNEVGLIQSLLEPYWHKSKNGVFVLPTTHKDEYYCTMITWANGLSQNEIYKLSRSFTFSFDHLLHDVASEITLNLATMIEGEKVKKEHAQIACKLWAYSRQVRGKTVYKM